MQYSSAGVRAAMPSMKLMPRFVAVALMASGLAGQGALKFEVASIKASPPQPGGSGGVRPAAGGERYVASNCPLKLLITVAFKVKGDHVVGGPDWIGTDRFDMNAKAARPS